MSISKENQSISWLPYMERTLNYNNWVFNNFKEHLGNRILDIGSGCGTFIEYYKNKSLVLSVDPSTEANRSLKKRFSGYNNIEIVKSDINDEAMLIYAKQMSIDTIVCLNVLEHISDDRFAIENIKKTLKSGGKLIIYVPAMKVIYGTLDKALGHYRRYDKGEFEKLLRAAGFSIVSSRYMNFLGALSWFLYSKILKKTIPAEARIIFYDNYLVPVVSRVESFIKFPFGQSLLIIARAD